MLSIAHAIYVQYNAGAIIQRQLRNFHTAAITNLCSTNVQRGAIFHSETIVKRSVRSIQRSVTVHPYRTVLHRTVKIHRTAPDVGVARIGMCSVRHVKDTISLLHQSGGSRHSAACQVALICFSCNIIVIALALYPCRYIDGEDGRRTTAYTQTSIAIFIVQHVLAIVAAINVGTATNNSPSIGYQRWGSLGITLHLAKEIAQVRWLVVGHHLPYHCLTVLVVVP